MPEILVSAILQSVIDRLNSPLIEKLSSMWDLKDDLEKLQSTLPKLQTVLEGQQHQIMVVGIWLTLLKEAASDAEDLLEDLATSINDDDDDDDDLDVDPQYADRVKEAFAGLQNIVDEVLSLNGVDQ